MNFVVFIIFAIVLPIRAGLYETPFDRFVIYLVIAGFVIAIPAQLTEPAWKESGWKWFPVLWFFKFWPVAVIGTIVYCVALWLT